MLKQNKINDLDTRAWFNFLKSYSYVRNLETTIQDFIEFFTKKNEFVLDPFAGEGHTLSAANKAGRNAIGIESDRDKANKAAERVRGMKAQTKLVDTGLLKTRQLALLDDAKEIDRIWEKESLPNIDFVFCFVECSIPDIENIFGKIKHLLKMNKYLVVVAKNNTKPDFDHYTFQVAQTLSRFFTLKGEKILGFESKSKPLGYGYVYVPIISHYTALVFQNDQLV